MNEFSKFVRFDEIYVPDDSDTDLKETRRISNISKSLCDDSNVLNRRFLV